MRIEWTPPLRAASQRRDDKGTVADRSFTTNFGGDAGAPAALTATGAMTAVEGLLSLQEISDGQGGRRRAIARGEDLLEALDELRHALLVGVLPRARLAALVRLAGETAPLVDDPRLAEILSEIELRAAVELAKLGDEV
ncbi:MAG TPA: flagellar assembly protein FliX [Stellaceae bacterium]|nr:flagellar assembly protein FliX [Stellaceae bacterium]